MRAGPRAKGRKIRYHDIPKVRYFDGRPLKFVGLAGPRSTLKGTISKYQKKGYIDITVISRERNNRIRSMPVYAKKKKHYKAKKKRK